MAWPLQPRPEHCFPGPQLLHPPGPCRCRSCLTGLSLRLQGHEDTDAPLALTPAAGLAPLVHRISDPMFPSKLALPKLPQPLTQMSPRPRAPYLQCDHSPATPHLPLPGPAHSTLGLQGCAGPAGPSPPPVPPHGGRFQALSALPCSGGDSGGDSKDTTGMQIQGHVTSTEGSLLRIRELT